jgi:hypothetical protein
MNEDSLRKHAEAFGGRVADQLNLPLLHPWIAREIERATLWRDFRLGAISISSGLNSRGNAKADET